jgi:stage IV sporulation protein B
LSNVSGTDVIEYKVEITRIYTGAESIGRSMMLSVTDPKLIEQTGGIVQGMSGSPIIQNGKIIGAVTHVLINDPTRGYGISIGNMLDTVSNETNKNAA